MIWATSISPRSLRRSASQSTAPLCTASLTHRPPQRLMGLLTFWSKSLDRIDALRSCGINVYTMSKGSQYSADQVAEAYQILFPNNMDKEPSYMPVAVLNQLTRMRENLGLEKLVMRNPKGGLQVLTDAEAVVYLNAQANQGIKKHKDKTALMHTHIDVSQLDGKTAKTLDANRRTHAFIASAAQGARKHALTLRRKNDGELPNYLESK